MDLTQLANLGEFIGGIGSVVGGIAVLATLIYLAVQVRQASANMKATPYQLALQGRTSLRMAVCTNERLLGAFSKGLGDLSQLTPEQTMQFHVFMVEEFRMIQFAYDLYKDGLSSPEAWEHELAVIGTYRDSPGFRAWWDASKSYYSDEFARLVDSTPPAPSLGLEALAASS